MSEREPERKDPTNEQQPTFTPRVWIATLYDYYDGYLHGAWVSADQEPEQISDEINEVLRTSRQPSTTQWAVFVSEGFGAIQVPEYENAEHISQLGRGIAKHGEAFATFINFFRLDGPGLLQSFEDSYLGHFDSPADYAEKFIEATGLNQILDEAVPKLLRHFVLVDPDVVAHMLESDGALVVLDDSDDGVYLFRAS